MKPRLPLLIATVIGCSLPGPARAQSINDARDLYAGAAYAEALEVIEAVEKSTPDAPAMREALQYRALCLLALSRPREAERTVAALVAKEPTYSPDAVEAPPQLRELFRVVREQQLPALVREKYAAARRSYAGSTGGSGRGIRSGAGVARCAGSAVGARDGGRRGHADAGDGLPGSGQVTSGSAGDAATVGCALASYRPAAGEEHAPPRQSVDAAPSAPARRTDVRRR